MEVTLGVFQSGLLFFGLLCAGVAAWLAGKLERRGRASESRLLGGGIAIVGWLLFVVIPTFHGVLNGPLLVFVAAAYPLIAVEAGRGLALRVFCWSALILNILGCGAYWVLDVSWRNIEIQEGVLVLGAVVPPAAALIIGGVQGARGMARSRQRAT